jgi:hypothetical protein
MTLGAREWLRQETLGQSPLPGFVLGNCEGNVWREALMIIPEGLTAELTAEMIAKEEQKLRTALASAVMRPWKDPRANAARQPRGMPAPPDGPQGEESTSPSAPADAGQ